MTCQIETDQGTATSIVTNVDRSSDLISVDDHAAALRAQVVSGATRLSSSIPGSGTVVTQRGPNQSLADFVESHVSNVLAAVADDPIVCP